MSAVTIRVPLTYNVLAIPKGARIPRSVDAAEWTEIRIETPDPDDAPVATADGDTPFTRWFDGSHWQREPSRNSDGDAVGWLSLADLEAAAASGRTDGSAGIMSGSYRASELALGELEAFDPDAYRQADVSRRGKALAALEARSRDVIAVDGQVWRRCGEPVYVLDKAMIDRTGGDGPRWCPFVMFLGEHAFRPPRPIDVYRIDRAEDVADEIVRRLGDPHAADDMKPLKVLLPESVNYRDDAEALLDAADRAVEFDRESLGRRDLPHVRTWLDFAEAARAARESGDASIIEAAFPAFEAGMKEPGSEYAPSIVATALARWEKRPISDFEFGHSPERKP